MADPRAVLRVVDELLWMLRRDGFVVSTAQAIDVARAVRAVGLDSKETLREAVALLVVHRHRERARFDATFDAYFARRANRTLWERLEAQGFSELERETLREALDAYASASNEGNMIALVQRGAELDRLLRLAGASRLLEAMRSPLQAGFYTHKLLDEVGATRAGDALSALAAKLADALGHERAEALAAALRKELELATDDVRKFVRDTLDAREADRAPDELDPTTLPLSELDDAEVEEVRRALARFVERLRGGARVRRRRAQRGRIDPHATLRRARQTGGVPVRLVREARRRDKPKLVMLCDVSESVKGTARFLLELAYSAQELFSGTRTFVFVSELGETTSLFEREPLPVALARAWSGEIVPVTYNSNYGRVLRAFEERVLRDVDRRTTVVIVGDGRTNYLESGAEVLDAVRARARAVIWLCPETRAEWATGDSAMARYEPKCTKVLEVRTARELEDAARLLVANL